MASKTDTARELVSIALDGGRPRAERLQALDEANSIRRGLKVGWPKLWDGRTQDDVDALLKSIEEAPDNFGDALLALVGQEASGVTGTDREADDELLGRVAERMSPRVVTMDPTKVKEIGRETVVKLDRGNISALVRHLRGANVRADDAPFMPETPPRPLTPAEVDAQRPVAAEVPSDLTHAAVERVVFSTPLAKAVRASKPKKAKASKPKVEGRGNISALVRSLLLDTDLAYDEIVSMVVAAHPKAATTARSIASVAADLRKAGRTVAMRRRDAKREA